MDDTNGHSPSKRPKKDIVLTDFVPAGVFTKEDETRSSYQESKPYPHGLLENVFRTEFLTRVRDEIKDNSKVNFKESDLFRVYQSIDLANLNETHATTMPSVFQLRDVLYSDPWRAFMERLCGLEPGTLTKEVDSACNCHHTGCHLLCHDDVIGTRKISYILYLTEDDWQRLEGGALELYDSFEGSSARVPETVPSKTILPLFNHMAFFAVMPGYSFHAVQEVFGNRPRLSLQGWFHAADIPKQIENATLQRLKKLGDEDTEGEFIQTSITPSEKLSEQDREYLSKYLNDAYLTETSIKEIRERFEEESSVQLRSFFKDSWIKMIQQAMSKEDSIPKVDDDNFYKYGLSDSWNLIGPSHKQRFLEYKGSVVDAPRSIGEILAHFKEKVMTSEPFGRFLGVLTSLGPPTSYRGRVRRFRRGLDYTVAHYGLLTEKPVLDATLCFVEGKGLEINEDQDDDVDEADMCWQSGDYGGFECYIEADEDDDQPAAEYDQDDDTELLSVSASNNTLSLVFRDPGTMRFVKYVGFNAPSSRWDIAMEYQVGDLEEEQEDEEALAEEE